jgi:fructose-specific phosphotransferase system component IIB
MSLIREKRGKLTYYTFQAGAANKIYLGPEDDIKLDRLNEAKEYVEARIKHCIKHYQKVLEELNNLTKRSDS